MALFLSTIRDKVQKELNRRANITAGEAGSPIIDENHNHNIERGGLYNRSTWIRVVPNTVLINTDKKERGKPILFGGIVYHGGSVTETGEPITTGLSGGIEGYEKREGTGEAGSGYKPKPGVTKVDVKTKGDLGSLTEITINWNCWSFDQLDDMSYYFMRPGASIIVEFGWSGVELESSPHTNPEEAMFNKQKWLNPNMEFYCGVITNFEWTGRDDGGFDCQTTLASGGSLLTQQEIKIAAPSPGSAAEQGFSDMREFISDKNGKHFYDFVKANCFENETKLKAGHKGVYAAMGTGGDDKDTSEKYYVYASMGWLEDNVFSKFLGLVNDGKNKGDSKKSLEFRSIEFVPADGDVTGKLGYYLPTKMIGHPDIVSCNPYEVFIPNIKFKGKKFKLGKFEKDESWTSWIWPLDDNITWGKKLPDVEWEKYFHPIDYYAKWNHTAGAEPEEESGEVWNYRNIVISNKLLSNAIQNVSTVNDFFGAIFDIINGSCGNVWKFALITDDDNTGRVKVVDLNHSEYSVKDIAGKTVTEGEDGIPIYKAYKFPVMGRNSIVKQQSLKMTIPDAAALTAMYGANSGESSALVGGSSQGGSSAHMDISMTVMSAFDSGDATVKAEDKLLSGLKSPGSNYGSMNPYTNIGLSNTNEKTTHWPNGENDKSGQLVGNSESPWAGATFVAGVGTTEDDQSDGEAGQLTVQAKKDKEVFDKAKDLSLILKNLSDDDKAELTPKLIDHDELKEDYLTKNDESLKDSDGNKKGEKFFKKFKEVIWTKLTATGGGWIMPKELRTYWWWSIKYMGVASPSGESKKGAETPGVVLRVNYMLPLELELQIDGVGGIQYGNAFQSEYLPEKYINNTLFQATEVNHSIDLGGWSTTLKGKMRYIELEETQNIQQPTTSDYTPPPANYVEQTPEEKEKMDMTDEEAQEEFEARDDQEVLRTEYF